MVSKRFLFVCAVVLICLHQTPCISAEELECYECDNQNPNCIDDVTKVDTKKGDADTEKCFVKSDKGVISRGIMGKNDECPEDKCVSCTTAKCNANFICQACDSSTSPSCAKNDTIDTAKNFICDEGATGCYMLYNTDKHTVRGCATKDQPGSCEDGTCKTCSQPNCNAERFPADRLLCYQCAPPDNCGTVTDQTPIACVNYEKNDKCTMSGATSTDMVRGCASDTNAKCTSNGTECAVCETSKCNSIPFEREQTLECNTCKDPDVSCSASVAAKKCEKNLKFYQENGCYVQVTDGKTSRGCLYDMFTDATACSKETNCVSCNTAECTINPTAFSCIECRSDTMPDCWNNANKIQGKECPESKDRPDGCYHGIWNGVAIRGCISNADPQANALCQLNQQCHLCTTANCNDKKSKASFIIINTSLLFLMSFLSRYF